MLMTEKSGTQLGSSSVLSFAGQRPASRALVKKEMDPVLSAMNFAYRRHTSDQGRAVVNGKLRGDRVRWRGHTDDAVYHIMLLGGLEWRERSLRQESLQPVGKRVQLVVRLGQSNHGRHVRIGEIAHVKSMPLSYPSHHNGAGEIHGVKIPLRTMDEENEQRMEISSVEDVQPDGERG